MRARVERRHETRTLALTLAAIIGPMFLTGALIAIDMRRDLSSLKAMPGRSVDGIRAVGWSDLAAIAPGEAAQARMIGYMMEGYKPVPDDTPIENFTLMPEAGHLLHPAHRDSEEMVEVWLPLDMPVRYSDRKLVWVSGALRRKQGRIQDGVAAFTMSNAEVRLASERQISDWFAP